ncbi:MAG: Nif3-like dinuclear metal center hexameric protein [Clostridia bacterium]|jgi:dinuclear metal center YbgI/SA1388 family protein|nr:Nif3-like dinuclear metal center hexameric protein [Clostridia bacterium]
MKLNEIKKVLENIAPPELAESWDNVGMLVETNNDEISKILVALDITDAVIDEAVINNIDLIVTHHPVLISGIKKVSINDFKGKQLIKLISNNISLYSMHTNFDITEGGTNDIIAKKLGLENLESLDSVTNLGKIGGVAETDLEGLVETLKGVLKLDTIKYTGDRTKEVSKLAICTGSGMGLYKNAISKGADVYITGDVKYHDAVDALESGLSIIDATHYSSENICMDVLHEYLSNKLDIDVVRSSVNIDPFNYL